MRLIEPYPSKSSKYCLFFTLYLQIIDILQCCCEKMHFKHLVRKSLVKINNLGLHLPQTFVNKDVITFSLVILICLI